MGDPLRHLLPDDLVGLVRAHAACLRIQTAFRRVTVPWLHFGHARDPLWRATRERWHRIGMLAALYPYPMMRKEWRQELTSWTELDATALEGLSREARATGMWGAGAAVLHNVF